MRPNPLVLHLEPDMREPFLVGDLVEQDEVDLVDMRGAWDESFSAMARILRQRAPSSGREVFAYVQVFTKPLPEWANSQPHTILDMLEDTLPLEAWAYNRPGIDWSLERGALVASDVNGVVPLVDGLMLDNWFPDLQPWMFKMGNWIPGWGAIKRKRFAASMREFEENLRPSGRILNGAATIADQSGVDGVTPWVMVERAAARKYEAETRVVNGGDDPHVILSIPAEETYNLPWLLELWMTRPNVALSFTSDSPTFGAASIYAYERAIAYRKDHD